MSINDLDPVLATALKDAFQELCEALEATPKPSFNRPDYAQAATELLLKEEGNFSLRMDGNRNHQRAHLHLDYHPIRRIASYAIDDGSLLAGESTHNNIVQPWISRHRPTLKAVWHAIREGTPKETDLQKLEQSSLK